MNRAIVVLTENRTASQSVYRALKEFEDAPNLIVRHAHELDGRARRKARFGSDEARRFARKDEKEAEVRRVLADTSLDRTIVTIRRDALDRLISDLWYSRHEVISQFYVDWPSQGAKVQLFHPELLDRLRKPIAWITDRSVNRFAEVWKPLNMPGLSDGEAGINMEGVQRFTLRFERLQADFDAMTWALVGMEVLPTSDIALPHLNTGAEIGNPAIYCAFKQWATL